MAFITWACVGSMVGGCGLSLWVKTITNPNIIGRIKNGSGTDKSLIQKPKEECRSSTISLNAKKKPIKNGICASTGKHPPRGLAPSFL